MAAPRPPGVPSPAGSESLPLGPAAGALQALEDRLIAVVQATGGPAAVVMGDLFAAGGKRLRPALCFLAAAIGTPRPEAVMNAALALEVCHAATLVHDDVLDRSPLRRGRPTAAALLGDEAAIVVGDQYFAVAYELAARTGETAAVSRLSQAIVAVCTAELEQQADRFRYSVTPERYLDRIRGKTAALFASAGSIGALLGGLDPARRARLQTYGEELGVAFQIVDDILDYTGDAAEVGKPVGHDLAEGHATLPLILGLLSGRLRGSGALLVDGRRLSAQEVTATVAAVRESGGVEAAFETAREHAARATAAAAGLPPSPARDALCDLPGRLLARRA